MFIYAYLVDIFQSYCPPIKKRKNVSRTKLATTKKKKKKKLGKKYFRERRRQQKKLCRNLLGLLPSLMGFFI